MWPGSLCNDCLHLRAIRSKRGSIFYLCGKAQEDERYRKYPPQPVLRCGGHVPRPAPEDTDTGTQN